MEICETSGLQIPIVHRLHQSNGEIKRKLRVWRVVKCIALVYADTVPTSAGPQTTPFLGRQYRAQNGNMRNFGLTNPHGTAFAPEQCLYQKEATGMEISKMHCPSWCRYHTYQCGAAKYSISWGAVQGPEQKNAKLRAYNFPWYRDCTKAMVISNGSYVHGELKSVTPQTVEIRHLPVRDRKLPRFLGDSIRPRIEIWETLGLPIPMVQQLHESNGHIKMKLRALTVQKSITIVGADTTLPSAGPKSTPFHWGQ